jgi:hypothetical protein
MVTITIQRDAIISSATSKPVYTLHSIKVWYDHCNAKLRDWALWYDYIDHLPKTPAGHAYWESVKHQIKIV